MKNLIDKIVDKHFEKVNAEGMGFLRNEIKSCKKELKEVLIKEVLIKEVADVISKIVCEDGELFEKVKSPAELFKFLNERYQTTETE